MLPTVVKEMAAGHRVAVASLFEFEFLSGVHRYWDGHGYLTAGGHEWIGFGQMGSVTGLEQSRGMNAPKTTFTLSGVDDDILAVAVNGSAEATGRPATVYLQFLTAAGVPLDAPVAIWAGIMDSMSFSAGVKEQRVSIGAETLFVDRVRAPWGFQTDTDQRARYPLDTGFQFVAKLIFKTVNWLRG